MFMTIKENGVAIQCPDIDDALACMKSQYREAQEWGLYAFSDVGSGDGYWRVLILSPRSTFLDDSVKFGFNPG